jgi:acyl-CoA synthetase (NDP forming)
VPEGRRVAILTNAGGPGILAADVCAAHGLELSPLEPATVAKFRAFLPAAASVGNPVDMLASAGPEEYRRSLRLVLSDGSVDSVLVIYIPPVATQSESVARAIVEAAAEKWGKPILATFMSAKGAPEVLRPIPTYPFPESAAIALARATTYGEWRSKPPGNVPAFQDLQIDQARGVVEKALARGGGWLGPLECEELLSAFGIATAPVRMARDEEGAVSAARELGFPVAVKAVGPTLLHKTEVGGVRLSLADENAVREACRALRGELGERLTDILVQAMVSGGVEVIAGVTYDPTFGPLILYGSGGVFVELLSDVAFRLHPLTDRDAAALLEDVKATALLRGFRGAPRADEGALTEMLLRISALVEAFPQVREMDLNPVKVLRKGLRVLDARVRVGRPPLPARSRRIAY